MRHTRAWLIIVATAAVLLAGCSGTGAPPAEVRGASVQTLASDQVSAAMLFQGWARILWVKGNGETPSPNVEDLGNGRTRLYGKTSDGASYDYTFEADGSGSGTITWAGDSMPARTSNWSAASMAGAWVVQTVSDTYSDGVRMDYEWRMDTATSGSPQRWEGTTRLSSGATMRFRWDRVEMGSDQLTLQLPDGSEMHVAAPLTGVFGAKYWPLFQQGATGHFKSAGGQVLNFSVKGATTEAWDQWSFTAGDGTSAAFTLTPELAGSGQLRRGSEVLGALRWMVGGLGTLDLLGSGQQSVNPSAAAGAFQMNRWVSNAAALGPAPVY